MVWPSPSERLHRPIPLWVEQVVSDESQGSPRSEGLVTHSSGAWPYEAMERGLVRPTVRTIKTEVGGRLYFLTNPLSVPIQ
jgi:hypothetical protein